MFLIIFPYYFHIISILFPYFLEEHENDMEEKWKNVEIIWISWFPECGKIMEKIWNKCGKIWNTYRKYGIHVENMEYV